jgi:hypothetical protein
MGLRPTNSDESPYTVMLSAAKHLLFFIQKQILRRSASQNDTAG